MTNGVLAMLLLGGATLAYAQLGTGRAAGETAVRTVTAARGTVVATVSASGSVESARSRALAFGTTGTVDRIYVQPGDKVKKGQILARLDDEAARENLAAALAAYEEARAQGTSTAKLNAAYVKARNAYRAADRTVAGTVLKAPFAGTVTAVNGTVGGPAGGTTATGTPSGSAGTGGSAGGGAGFVEVADTGKLQLVGAFTESDVGKLKVGQEAAVTFDALPGVTATGKVTQIQPVAATSENVVQYPVTITFTSVPGQVRLGQTSTVEVEVGRAEDVVTVPSAAVSTGGGQDTVTVLRNGQPATTVVEVGVRGTATTEIRSGVSEGDRLVPPATAPAQSDRRQGGFPGGGGSAVLRGGAR